MRSAGDGMMRILVIDARVITPDRDGGSLRMYNFIKILRGRGHHVEFLPFFAASFPPFDATLERDTQRLLGLDVPVHASGGDSNVETHLRTCGSRYDTVLISGIYVASRCAQAVRKHAPGAVLMFDTIDVHFLREFREAKVTRNVHRIRNALKVRDVELAVARNADVTLVVSDREKQLLEEESSEIHAFVLPNIHEVVASPAPFEARRDLYYLGAYTFQPNIDAAVHFVRELLPAVGRRLPGIRFYVAGADPTEEVCGLESEDVIVTRYIRDLEGFFNARRVCVVPLRYGAGIKGKVLLSMAHGVPVVTSAVGAEGIPASDGVDLLIARDAGDWPVLIERVYGDRDLWYTLSGNGRHLIEREYSFAAVAEKVDTLLAQISARGRKGAPAHA